MQDGSLSAKSYGISFDKGFQFKKSKHSSSLHTHCVLIVFLKLFYPEAPSEPFQTSKVEQK